MNRKTKFKIIWAIYCFLIAPFILIDLISYLFERISDFCTYHIGRIKYWIITKYKPND